MHQNIRDDFNQLADCCILQAEYFLKNQDGEFYLYPQSIDAIATVMAHCESKDQFVYYFPYAIAGEKIEFYEAFGEKHASIQ